VQLGNLYSDVLQGPEEAVACYQRAAEIYCQLGDVASEGKALSGLAMTFLKLQRFDESRVCIKRGIQSTKSSGHEVEPWKFWYILANIETSAGNSAAAADARHQALNAYLAYRHDGGKNQNISGRLALAVHEAIASGDPAKAASSLQQLAADPRAASMLPFLTALQAIAAGSRDRSLADEPGLDYDEAAEVLPLIEALEQVGDGP
jgi:tetratricopeptide (TPR) repeat protein